MFYSIKKPTGVSWEFYVYFSSAWPKKTGDRIYTSVLILESNQHGSSWFGGGGQSKAGKVAAKQETALS